MRRYIRHPASIPIEVTAGEQPSEQTLHTQNVGEFGIALRAGRELSPGTAVRLRVPTVSPPFETAGRVVWCNASAGGYEVGVEFADPDEEFRARMFEQICRIEDYRREVLKTEGRELSANQAATEWIARFASEFPRSD